MLPTLRTLLNRPELGLRLVTAAPPDALERAVLWAHSSDLPDPTPFLSPGQVLLTTGTWLDGDPDVDAYVARLVDRGLVGLGFGTEVIRDGTPDTLVSACSTHGLPLFEVPYRIPFIAVSRTIADLAAEDAYARHTWALDAQRAISLAALRPDGLRAALAELARSLGHGVALFDEAGGLDRVFPADAIDPIALVGVRRDVERLLRRGQRGSAAVEAGTTMLTLHTLGGRNRLRGVLAVGGGGSLDQQEREVVASVVGLASLALEARRDVDDIVGRMRASVLGLLLDGEVALAERLARQLWGGLPPAGARLAVLTPTEGRPDPLTDALERASRADPEQFFHGVRDGEIVAVVAEESIPELAAIAAAHAARCGLSRSSALLDPDAALRQARFAVVEAEPGCVRRFADIAARGLIAAIAGDRAREVATAVLAPLTAHDATNDGSLVATMRAWLEADAQIDRAAATLGVHRHTVRARIGTAERLLGVDLSRFAARAELWAAFASLDEGPPGADARG